MDEVTERRSPLVAIGASAGGIEAFRLFFTNMPADTGMTFIVILHLPSDRKSVLQDILSRWTAMPVLEITDGCTIEANHVYLPPPGVLVTLEDGRLHLHRLEGNVLHEHSPISALFSSLAEALGEDVIGVVLSGTGTDGALGLKAIKQYGGLTLAQGADGTEPEYDGMPSSAIATGAVDMVVSVEAMPRQIQAVLEARRKGADLETLPADRIEMARLEICRILTKELGHDFSGYKTETFLRRVERRMQVLGLSSIEAFADRLRHDRHEAVMLFRDLLIGVTSFFRDATTFALIARDILPRVFAGKGRGETVRAWVPGCATGEEVYSLAILMHEHLEALGDNAPSAQLFATDIDETAIATARAGRYPAALLQDMSPGRLSRYFVPGVDGSYTVHSSIRDLCTFSPHSLTRDPPFSRMNLISCRNLLIYLDLDMQDMVIPAFHYALVKDGILLLGSSETVSRHEGLFKTLDRSHRIYQKRDVPGPPLRIIGRVDPRTPAQGGRQGRPELPPKHRTTRPPNWAHARVLDRYAPPFLVVTADGTSVQYSSHLTRYLELPQGVPTQNALLMARAGLRLPLRDALREAVAQERAVERPGISVRTADGSVQRLTLVIDPQRDGGMEALFLVVLLEEPDPQRTDAAPALLPPGSFAPGPDRGSERDLEAELNDTREQLQAITEEHDTAVEELRSANEELHSVNEELQSTNEELETSKEEIQSMNEELQTVNGQLAAKVDELDRRNSDLKNLFDSTQVATVFLDRFLIVRSFTPAIANLYNLIPSDQGRPITDIVSRLRGFDLREDCQQVLRSLEPLERRVSRDDGLAHYLMRIMPYRTQDSVVSGTIVTFVEVTSIVQAEQHQRLLVDELNHRVKNMLTVVIAIARQTLRRADTLAQFEDNFMGRIHALTAAYSLLSNEAWRTVSLRSLLLEELRPFQSPDRGNIVLSGPPVELAPRAALALGMAIHELTTNAVKYGALSSPEGVVEVTWQRFQGPPEDELLVEWIERGGPPVSAPAKKGFGMVLIERGLKQDMSAQVDIEFGANGVRARFRAPMPPESGRPPG